MARTARPASTTVVPFTSRERLLPTAIRVGPVGTRGVSPTAANEPPTRARVVLPSRMPPTVNPRPTFARLTAPSDVGLIEPAWAIWMIRVSAETITGKGTSGSRWAADWLICTPSSMRASDVLSIVIRESAPDRAKLTMLSAPDSSAVLSEPAEAEIWCSP